MIQELEEVHEDFLKEMANIGAGNAGTLLSTLTATRVNVTVSHFKMTSSSELTQTIKATDKLVVVQYASISGELKGSVLLVFPRESALSLLDLLTKRRLGATKWLSKEDQKTLQRIGKSLVKCYLDAITNFLNLNTDFSEPKIFSVFGETINGLLDLVLKQRAKRVFYLNTKMHIKPNIEGEFYFLFDEDLSSFLLEKSKNMLSR